MDGQPYRQINRSFEGDWTAMSSSGLLKRLIGDKLLVEHEEAGLEIAPSPGALAVIKPRQLPFISYPYEWSFAQLRDAALLTLRVAEIAVEHGLTLRDASAYNVQFDWSRPILIDSLSFERLGKDATWKPYRQFCEHFLAPLALIAYDDPRTAMLLRTNLGGIPLDLAQRLLPMRSRLNRGLLAHIHLHARAQRRAKGAAGSSSKMGHTRLLALLDGLRRTIEHLRPTQRETTWAHYTPWTSYSQDAAQSKEQIVRQLLGETQQAMVWSVGANDGHYSGVAADLGHHVVALDADAVAVERHYLSVKRSGRPILPLVMDVTNPSPHLGWNGKERRSIFQRANADVVMALALIHHLTIGHNVPFDGLSDFLRRLAPRVLLEWVPKEDPMVQRLLATREDVFPDYTLDALRRSLSNDFSIAGEVHIQDSPRIILDLRRNG
jgi:hypothetical protein